MPLKRTVAPVLVALDIDDIKSYLGISIDTFDADLIAFVDAATRFFEEVSETALLTQTYELKLNSFRDEIDLEKPPLQSVTSIKYYDTDGVEQTLSDTVYDVDIHSQPGRITLAYDQSWPTIREIINGITITYVAGYTAAELIPAPIRQALKLHVGHLHENRELSSPLTIKEVPMGYWALIGPHRMIW